MFVFFYECIQIFFLEDVRYFSWKYQTARQKLSTFIPGNITAYSTVNPEDFLFFFFEDIYIKYRDIYKFLMTFFGVCSVSLTIPGTKSSITKKKKKKGRRYPRVIRHSRQNLHWAQVGSIRSRLRLTNETLMEVQLLNTHNKSITRVCVCVCTYSALLRSWAPCMLIRSPPMCMQNVFASCQVFFRSLVFLYNCKPALRSFGIFHDIWGAGELFISFCVLFFLNSVKN